MLPRRLARFLALFSPDCSPGPLASLARVDAIGKLLIRHPKPVIFALNGPVVGITAAWTALADIVLVADSATLHVPFSSLGLIPEGGAATSYVLRMGPGMASEVLMFGRKLSAQEMVNCGFAQRILPTATFSEAVDAYLAQILEGNHPVAILKAKRLIREQSMPTLLAGNRSSVDEMASHMVTGIPAQQIAKKVAELKGWFDGRGVWMELIRAVCRCRFVLAAKSQAKAKM